MASMRSDIFFARVVEMGVEDAIPSLKAKGLTTYARFAFGSEFTPANPDTTILTNSLLAPLAGDDADLIPLLRMLWWESWGVATADMKRSAEGTERGRPQEARWPRSRSTTKRHVGRAQRPHGDGGLRY